MFFVKRKINVYILKRGSRMTKNHKREMIWEVFDISTPLKNQTIGFVKAPTYAIANAEAFKKYMKPIDVCIHEGYTKCLQGDNLWMV